MWRCAHSDSFSLIREATSFMRGSVVTEDFWLRSRNIIFSNTWCLLGTINDVLKICFTLFFRDEEFTWCCDVIVNIVNRSWNQLFLFLEHRNIVSWLIFVWRFSDRVNSWLISVKRVVFNKFVTFNSPFIVSLFGGSDHILKWHLEFARPLWLLYTSNEILFGTKSNLHRRVSAVRIISLEASWHKIISAWGVRVFSLSLTSYGGVIIRSFTRRSGLSMWGLRIFR